MILQHQLPQLNVGLWGCGRRRPLRRVDVNCLRLCHQCHRLLLHTRSTAPWFCYSLNRMAGDVPSSVHPQLTACSPDENPAAPSSGAARWFCYNLNRDSRWLRRQEFCGSQHVAILTLPHVVIPILPHHQAALHQRGREARLCDRQPLLEGLEGCALCRVATLRCLGLGRSGLPLASLCLQLRAWASWRLVH